MAKFFLLFIPSLLCVFINDPNALYLTAWLGSAYLIILSIYTCKYILNEQIGFFSPIVLSQGLFWGYTALTSIFYFIDQHGYEFFERVKPFANIEEIKLIAQAQVYIVFAHACYLTGYYLIKAKRGQPKYLLNFKNNTYFNLSIASAILAATLQFAPIAQLSSYLSLFSTICAVHYFGIALRQKRHIPLASIYLISILIIGFFSGMKENTIYPIIFLGIIAYENYGVFKTSLFFIPLMAIYFYYVPTYNAKVRESRWYQNKSTIEAFDELSNTDFDAEVLKNNNWTFLTDRVSEISMFTTYLQSVPQKRPYYEFEIVGYGLASLVPRFIWPDKPSPDATAQKRAIENGALILNYADDTTSAKPQTIVDAYLSYGYLAIAITYLLFGIVLKLALNLCYAKLGYEFGISTIFYCLFSILSRGGCFENLFNTITYAFILIYVWIEVLKKYKLIIKN
ncbi:hypothetical protein [Pedobacter sp. UBA4863]|uniref:hypothetical protein n=1 Tax=Pedobacter sp. UBA4863 TaxID=1947060 RepID=UPI0025DFC5C4|nr:hypothetical protein [Pedobacter sp. UBA4863]